MTWRLKIFPVNHFLDAFAKLRKATIGFNMSVCTSVRMETLSSHLKDFHEILHFITFRKSVEKNSSVIKIGQK